MAILNTSGEAVVEYTYDAWGNIHDVSGSLVDTIGEANPLTYRGYVYDSDSGYYYLQSRYYDPEVGRFINADALVATGQGLLGNNMIAYCCNNPVNNIDPDGHSVIASILLNVLVDGGINAMMILMQGGSIHDAIGAALETIPSAVFEGLSPQWVVLVYNFISASFKSWKSGKSVGESLFIGAVSVLTSVSLPNSLDEDLYKALEPLLGIEQTIVSTALNQYTGEYDITPEETPPLIISAVGGGSYAGGIILSCVHLM